MRCKNFLPLLVLLPFQIWAQSESIIHNGAVRSYIIHTPPQFSSSENLPLLLCLHGLFQTNDPIQEVSQFDSIADRERFIAVYPLGTSTSWNSFGDPFSGVDDVGFISALIDSLHTRYNINKNRVYAAGMSNGGFMSYLLACLLSEKIAAIASVAGSSTPVMLNVCNPTRAVPILEIHGTSDFVVTYDGGVLGLGIISNSVDTTIEYWVQKNNCAILSDSSSLPDVDQADSSTVTKFVWSNCTADAEVILYRINNGGHTWPGSPIDFGGAGGNVNNDFHASETIWDFFSRYSLDGKLTSSTQISSPSGAVLYPNPASNELKIFLGKKKIQALYFTDLAGKLLAEITDIHNDANFITLSLKDIPAGTYLLFLHGKTLRPERVIVMK